MRRSRAGLAVAGVAVLLVAGCGGDDGSADPTTSTSTSTSTEAVDPTASTAPTAADTPTTAPPDTVSGPTAFTATAADAVDELKAAWEAGDRPRAAAIAPGEVVDALFAVPAAGFEVYGCDTGEFPTSTCDYRNRSTGTFIKVGAKRTDGQGWQISTIDVGTVGDG